MHSRPVGFGCVGGISLADMAAYIQAHPFCEAPMFFRVIRALDALYIETVNTTSA
jgi:hypothetical protein